MKKQNVVFILADDMGAWAYHASGNDDVITPNLDRLADRGVRFDDFFCVSPVCSPARASILSGSIPSYHGVHDWLRGGNLDRDGLGELKDDPYYKDELKPIGYMDGTLCYTDELAREGYDCALVGKWHLGDSMRVQHGFNHWYTIGRGGCEYFRPDIVEDGKLHIDDRYITDLVTEHAVEYLEKHDDEKPFYMSVHYTAPHSPWDRKHHPEDVYSMYENCTYESTPDLPLHPNQLNSAPHGTGEERKRLLRGYYTAITAMDAGVGKIMDELERKGILDDTLVIFTSDNGMNMGHHGVWGKGNGTFPLNMYDTSVKVPMIISCPDRIPSGRVVSSMFSHYDLYPTILDFCGVKCLNYRLPGHSFKNMLLGNEEEKSSGSLVVYDEYGSVRMIRTETHKLVYRYPYGPHELYDLVSDPDEKENLFGKEEYREIQESLVSQMQEWFARYVTYERDGSREGVSGFGQLCECGMASKGRTVYHGEDW